MASQPGREQARCPWDCYVPHSTFNGNCFAHNDYRSQAICIEDAALDVLKEFHVLKDSFV